ncbi:MAG TPA: TlpA disulfide reductase family protein [Sphingobacterium sp.]|nr:TlpA disulfide reductase family protein [Sphingobacterium sp.]
MDKIVIEGEIINPGNVRVVAFYEGDRKLDSVFLSDRNKFKFERAATQPRLFSMRVGNNRYPLIVTPGERLYFRADMQGNPEQYHLEGSDLSESLQDFTPIKQRKEFVEDSLQTSFVQLIAGKSEQEVESLRAEFLSKYKAALRFYTEESVKFAKSHPDLAGFYVMSTLDHDLAEQELIAYSDRIQGQFPDNRVVNQFREEVEKLKRLAVGQPAPEIVAYTPNNRMVKLSDFRGKHTLVDFWASWCVPCRKENPSLVKLYNAYKDQGFDIFGVSLDNNPGSWMRAIEEDKLVWTNASDLKAWGSDLILDYRIKAIPASVLVDPEGNILTKNLRGKDLEAFLQTLFE